MAQPLRAAAIDIGSNGIRFIVADAQSDGSFEVVHKQRAAVRLGHDSFTAGRLDPDTAAAAVEALEEFRMRADELGVHRMRAVATSAVREAEDCRDFVKAARKQAGIRIDVIDGQEEARLVHRAMRSRIPWGDKPWLVMDLGGGSLEIALIDRDRIYWSESRQVGTVRLLEKHADAGPLLSERIHQEVDCFQMLHSPEGLDIGGVAATGGNINDLAWMDGTHPRREAPVGLALETLDELRRGLEALSVEERMEAHGMRADRADVIVPAALVYERVAYLAGAEAIHVPGWGVREGVILDLLDAHFDHRVDQDPKDKRVEDSALAIGRAFRFDEDHGQQVAHLALQLFDQTKPLHGMGNGARRTLHAACILHDVGRAISEKGHHKHSQYLIEHASLDGLKPKHIRMAGTIARHHRGPVTGHWRDDARAAPLAAMCRIANALDSDRVQQVRNLDVAVTESMLTIVLRGRGSKNQQCAEALARADLWKDHFGMDVTIMEKSA